MQATMNQAKPATKTCYNCAQGAWSDKDRLNTCQSPYAAFAVACMAASGNCPYYQEKARAV